VSGKGEEARTSGTSGAPAIAACIRFQMAAMALVVAAANDDLTAMYDLLGLPLQEVR